MLTLGATLMGLFFAPIFQTVLGIAGDLYEQHSGSVFGLMFAFALLGSMLLPWIAGQVSQHSSVRYGMFVPLIGTLCVSWLALSMRRYDNVRSEEKQAAAV
jgi:fucose permease